MEPREVLFVGAKRVFPNSADFRSQATSHIRARSYPQEAGRKEGFQTNCGHHKLKLFLKIFK